MLKLLQQLAYNSQVYSDSLVFLTLRMIHQHPPFVGVGQKALALLDLQICNNNVQRFHKGPHPRPHFLHPLSHPPPTTPPQAVRR